MKIKLNEVTLHSIIKDSINKILAEEMSIADEVKAVTNEIFEMVVYKKMYDFVYQFYNIGEFHILCKDIEIKSPNEDVPCLLHTDRKILELNIPKYKGEIMLSTLKANIMHEVEHLYQIDRTNGNVSGYEKLYETAVNILINESSTKKEKCFAQFVYCCSTKEQDAFVNELYSNLMSKQEVPDENIETTVVQYSQAYRALVIINEVVNELNTPIGELRIYDELKVYGKTNKWFINLGRNASKRLRNKINNVIRKSRKDLNNKTFVVKI